MDEHTTSLLFSWDPRAQAWVKERGPEDATPPPAAPIDNGSVQSYFLNTQNGRWQSTILALRARQISVDLGDDYRAPLMVGLALLEQKSDAPKPPKQRKQRSDAPNVRAPRAGAPLAAGAALLLILGGGAIVAGQTLLGPSVPAVAAPSTTTSAAPSSSMGGYVTDASPTADVSPSAEPAASTAASTAPQATRAPVRTAAPTPRPPQTIRLSVRLPNGTQVFYSGPAAAVQGGAFQAIFSVVLPSGQGGNESLTVYLGDPNVPAASTNTLGNKPDANGNYVLTLRTDTPRGDQRLSVIYGTTAGVYTLGSISIQ